MWKQNNININLGFNAHSYRAIGMEGKILGRIEFSDHVLLNGEDKKLWNMKGMSLEAFYSSD